MTVLRVPSRTVIQGPEQIANTFNSNAIDLAKDLSLLDTGGSSVMHGNLLTLPIGNSFLYVEPLYVQASGAYGLPDPAAGAGGLRRQDRLRDQPGRRAGQPEPSAGGLAARLSSRANRPAAARPAPPVDRSSTNPSTSPSSSPPAPARPAVDRDAGPEPDPDPAQHRASTTCQAAYKSGDPAKIGAAQAKVAQLTKEYLKASRASRPVECRSRVVGRPAPDLVVCSPAGKVGLTDAGWSSSVARWAHNPEVAGSNPVPATSVENLHPKWMQVLSFVPIEADAVSGDPGMGGRRRGRRADAVLVRHRRDSRWLARAAWSPPGAG